MDWKIRGHQGRHMLRRLAVVACMVFTTIGAASESASAQRALTVSATTPIFADFARQVGGDRVEVVQLVGDGVDIHDYQMTPNDLLGVNRSQLLIFNGYELEPFLRQVLVGAGPNLTLVELAQGLTPIMDGRNPNPHFWLNPQFAARYVERIRDAFVAADPAGADTYRANAARYLSELAALDAELETQFGVIPTQNRKLVVMHDAFPYFARRYGFDVIGSVLSAEAREPSPNELIALVRQVRQAGVRVVFTEPQFNPRMLEQVAREARVQIVPLYSDTFPADGSIRGYVDMMRANARNIVEGLR